MIDCCHGFCEKCIQIKDAYLLIIMKKLKYFKNMPNLKFLG